MKNNIEYAHQKAVIDWASYYPVLASILYHVPNGGARSKAEGARFKAIGVRAGMPDLHLPIAADSYNGLWIEMKSNTGYLSKFQKEKIKLLESLGHKCLVCMTALDAIAEIKNYLKNTNYKITR